jgi:hypothetical protein
MVRMLLANIFEISSASFNIVFVESGFVSSASRNKQSQYFVSFADRKAISKYLKNSLFELEDFASIIFAPTEVEDLIN